MRCHWFTAALCLCTTASQIPGQQQTSARIYGLILDQENGKPIPEVHVSLSPGNLSAKTGTSGRFVLEEIPFGDYTIQFERLGYVTRVDTVRVGAGLPSEITLRLATSPVALDPIQVTVRSGALQTAGFYDRRENGPQGTFFTEADVKRFEPRVLTDLMHRAPATIVLSAGPGRTMLRFNRQVGMSLTGPPGCEPAVFLDGMLLQDQVLREPRLLDFNRVSPSVVAGIEVYVGVGTPIAYKRNPCGSVLIWTKRGG